MEQTTKAVEVRIESLLPDNFSILIDGWSKNSTHFVGIYACYCGCESDHKTVLLGFLPLLSEESQSAQNHVDLIHYVLSVYGKSTENVVAITCLLYTSPSPRDGLLSRMPSSA